MGLEQHKGSNYLIGQQISTNSINPSMPRNYCIALKKIVLACITEKLDNIDSFLFDKDNIDS
jgi:hypothetical protein